MTAIDTTMNSAQPSTHNARAQRICTFDGCNAYVTNGRRCAKHIIVDGKRDRERRGTSTSRGYDYRWRNLRIAHLRGEPLCRSCLSNGRTVAATQVDHIKAHRGNESLRLNPANLQSLCASCHSAKTVREDGAFGYVSRGAFST